MITLNNVKKSFGQHEVLRDVTFSVNKGELLTITGDSGSGKTTILNIVSGTVKPDSGTVRRSSDRIGYAFQKDILIPWMSAIDNIVYILKQTLPGKEAYETAIRWLEKMDLDSHMHKTPSSMSGGMKKRLNIARALSIEPEILLLDEPFVFLDQEHIANIKELINDMVSSGKSAVILVSHDVKHSDDIGGHIVGISGNPVVIKK